MIEAEKDLFHAGVLNDNVQFWGAFSTRENPDANLHELDIYTAAVYMPT